MSETLPAASIPKGVAWGNPEPEQAGRLGSLVTAAAALKAEAAALRARLKSVQHAWVNYDAGLSQGRGDGGRFYIATGDKKWSHDEVYAQNPALRQAVGTKDAPTAAIFDCTQGTVGKGQHGEATNERMLRYRANRGKQQGIQALELLKALRTQKKEASRHPCDPRRFTKIHTPSRPAAGPQPTGPRQPAADPQPAALVSSSATAAGKPLPFPTQR